jgi:hypothetical protein
MCKYVCALIIVSAALCQTPAETESYNAVIADINANNFTKAVTDLEAWKQKLPESAYNDQRLTFFVQAYAATNQPARALNSAAPLLTKDLSKTFPGPTGQATIIRLLYSSALAISHLPDPTPEQLATGEQAARGLIVYDQPLPGLTPEKWAEVRADMKDKGEAALLYIAILPGTQAMSQKPTDCPAADKAYRKALLDYPTKAAVAYELGRALNCESKDRPELIPQAIYEFVRAAALDPTLGNPANDPKKIQAVGDTAYVRLHGSDEGLAELKKQAAASPLPPEGFTITSADQIADRKRAELEQSNPQLALWLKVKDALTAPDGDQYFETQMKGAAMPPLAGTLLDAKPACRPDELLVAIPQAGVTPSGEIRLKLDKPLTGKPALNSDIHWEGSAQAFTRDPFTVTMEVERNKIQGLTTAPCRRP